MEKFIITEKQIDDLRPYVPKLDDLLTGHVNDLLSAIDDVMTYDDDWEPTVLTLKLEKIYDTIYGQNLDD